MTRRRINTVEEAVAAARANRDRLQALLGEEKKPGFAERIEARRK
ncbi:hypothetical protein R5W24_000535 [Gemmata sp. JC717]|nr:hypothetical protein [Gemmata algarum]MDY3551459.1 hypothetical protein [Gemmata algarum]